MNILKLPNKIGLRNILGLKMAGKLTIVENEMKRLGLLILEISETHWNQSGKLTSTNWNFVFSSGNNCLRRVAVIVDGRCKNLALGARSINDRITIVSMKTIPVILSIIGVYVQTSAAPNK